MADVEKELDIILKAQAQQTEQIAAVKQEVDGLSASVTASATAHEKHATAAKKAAEEEHIITAESRESARAFGELGAKGGELFERFSALTTAAGGLQGTLTGGLLLGLGVVAEGVTKVNETYREQQSATLDLQQAASATGRSYEELNKQFEEFVNANVEFIPNENAAKDALADFVRAGFTADDSLKALNTSLDIAAIKNEDLKTASNQLLLAMEGSGKAVKDLGVNVAALVKDDENAQKAHQDLAKATAAVAKDQDAYASALARQKLLEDELSGKRKLSAADLDRVAAAQKSVTDAANNLHDAQTNESKAQDDVNKSMDTATQTLDAVGKKTDEGKKHISDLDKQQDQLNHDWDKFASGTGPAVQAVWEGILGTLDGVLQLLDDIPAAAEAAWNALSKVPGPGSGRPAGLDVPRGPSVTAPPAPGSAGGGAGGTVASMAPAAAGGQTNIFNIQAQDPAATVQAIAAYLNAS